MISIEQYRVAVGLYNLRSHVSHSSKVSAFRVSVMPVLFIVAATCSLVVIGVILAGDVEVNPGPRCAVVDCCSINISSLHRFPLNTRDL